MFDIILNSVIPFLIILTILVFVHELGHYLAAIFNGVKVDVFSIGFGKELFGFTDNSGTRWKFSLLPLGGYVKMHGDEDPSSSKKNESIDDDERSFHNKSIAQRSVILFSGPAANFLFSIFLLIFINCFYGYNSTKPIISDIELNSPAEKANLQVNDTILKINEVEILDFNSLQGVISKNKPLNITFSRNDKIQEVLIIPENGKIGIRGTVITQKLSIFDSCIVSIKQFYNFIKMTLIGIYEMIAGKRGADDLGGPIRIAELSGDFWSKGVQSTLWFMMIISLNLGLINLFPIPMLDGGHLLLNFIEFVKGSPLNKKSLEMIHMLGLILLLSLMIFATYNDVIRIIK
jgi:regulator of sigma E protease|tara:strand:+ start:4162 stop:5202 length:1041 start_codon:yes stop_codon:yes gene_type:complete